LRQQLARQEPLIERSKQVGKALQESEANLRTFMENARGFGVYIIEPDENEPYATRNVFISPSIKDILGIEHPEKNANWFESLHPDDVDRVTAAHHIALKGSNEFDETCRLFHQGKQEWRWIRAISSVVKIPEMTSTRFNGLIMDVTNIKNAEETLQKAYDELEKRVKERTIDLARANARESKDFDSLCSMFYNADIQT